MKLKPNDVVQINPAHENQLFRGCFMQVTEVYAWGVQGFICIPESKQQEPGHAYFRCNNKDFEYIGPAVWKIE